MLYKTVDSDIYGRVKTVGRTPIVTRFATVRLLPIYPIESYYRYCNLEASRGCNLIHFTILPQPIFGAPLAKLDWTSVIVTYLRCLFGLLAVAGLVFAFVPVATFLDRQRPPDPFVLTVIGVSATALLTGILGIVATYLIPLTRLRDARIRRHCAPVLGYAFDPARVPPDFAEDVKENAAEFDPDALHSPEMMRRIAEVQKLILLRCALAQGGPAEPLELATDEQLDLLDGLTKKPE